MPGREDLGEKRILLVEADQTVAARLGDALGAAGYAVVHAAGAEDGAAAAREQPFDAALISRGDAGYDAVALLELLARLQPGCLRLLMTGMPDDTLVAVSPGELVRVIARPHDTATLLATIEGVFASALRIETATTERMIESHRQERRWFDETVRGGLLRLALQPIVEFDGDTPKLVAYEALLRPQHPAWASPEPVLVVAERLARVGELGARVFRLAADAMMGIPAPIGLFVNLHPIQLAHPPTLLRDLGPLMPHAKRITLEITERAHPLAVDSWEPVVAQLVDRGFSLAIDDLGAGSAGLVMLASLQPQTIKLDMSLVRGIEVSPRKRRLIQLLVTFADTTGARVLAEGVESAAEVTALRACGIRMMQGYLFGRPSLDGDSAG